MTQAQIDMLRLIAQMNMVTAEAQRDVVCGDGWRSDYAAWHAQLNAEYDQLRASSTVAGGRDSNG